jgi:hypothetical protein
LVGLDINKHYSEQYFSNIEKSVTKTPDHLASITVFRIKAPSRKEIGPFYVHKQMTRKFQMQATIVIVRNPSIERRIRCSGFDDSPRKEKIVVFRVRNPEELKFVFRGHAGLEREDL